MRAHEAADYLGIATSTVRLWTNTGRLPCHRSAAGQRIFYKEELDEFLRQEQGEPEAKPLRFFYLRSSSGEDVALETQLVKLEERYGQADHVFRDRASGLKEDRRGLTKMLEIVCESDTPVLVHVTNKDRLTRFGFSYLEKLIQSYGGVVEVLDSPETKEPQVVLMEDFMALIASFSGRFYRLRGWDQQKRLLGSAQKVVEDRSS